MRRSRSKRTPACRSASPRRTQPHPTATTPRDCRRAGADTASSRLRGGSARGWRTIVSMNVAQELALAVKSPLAKAPFAICALDFMRVRDSEILGGELLDFHFEIVDVKRADWDRWQWLRANVKAEHV